MPPPVSFARGPARLPNANRKARGGWLGLGADPARHQPKRLMSHGGKGWRAALGPLRRHSTPLIALHDNPLVRWGKPFRRISGVSGYGNFHSGRRPSRWTPTIGWSVAHSSIAGSAMRRTLRRGARRARGGARARPSGAPGPAPGCRVETAPPAGPLAPVTLWPRSDRTADDRFGRTVPVGRFPPGSPLGLVRSPGAPPSGRRRPRPDAGRSPWGRATSVRRSPGATAPG